MGITFWDFSLEICHLHEMTEVEEEALVPLVRNRKSKPTTPKKAYIPSHVSNIGQTLKSTDSTIKNELVEKPKYRQNLKRIRKFFSTEKDTPSKLYYIIGGELFLLFVTCVLLFWCYHHPSWFHFQVTRAAANLGHLEAQHLVGQKLLHGHGVQVNEAQAMEWFSIAAQKGHPMSSYNLAIGHLNGIDTKIDDGEHEDLLRHAARHGVEGAQAVLDHICRSGECLGEDDYDI